jgi:hypothetical protein
MNRELVGGDALALTTKDLGVDFAELQRAMTGGQSARQ